MSTAKEITIREIGAALDQAPGAFTLDEFIKMLHGGRSKALRERICRLLENDERLFCDQKDNFRFRRDFFTGREFLVTPDEWEISQGILFPGHRFVSLASPEIFPSEITLQWQGKTLQMRELTLPLGKVFHYHTLLGSDQVFDFLVAESPANSGLMQSARPGDAVTLGAFDLAELYAGSNFAYGDALVCRVEDYETGRFSVRPLSGDRRSARDRRAWVEAMDAALAQVFERFEGYLEIPEQLAWACYFGGAGLSAPAASLDEYLAESAQVEIRADGDHAILALRRQVAEPEAEPEIPGMVGISKGETLDAAAMLKEAGSSLTMVELESFILDQCSARDLNFDDFFSRAFGRSPLNYADAAQEAVMLNFLEERFEYLTENYNRVDDEPKAPLRSRILELVEARMELFRFLADRGGELPHEARHLLQHLASVSLQLDELLGTLNDPGFTPDESGLAKLDELAERRENDQEELIERIQDLLEGDNK